MGVEALISLTSSLIQTRENKINLIVLQEFFRRKMINGI